MVQSYKRLHALAEPLLGTFTPRSPRVLHRLEQLINCLGFFVVRLAQFFVAGNGRERRGQIIQFEMRERKVKIDERKARLNLRGCFIVKARERKLTGVEIEIAKIVMRLDVARFML